MCFGSWRHPRHEGTWRSEAVGAFALVRVVGSQPSQPREQARRSALTAVSANGSCCLGAGRNIGLRSCCTSRCAASPTFSAQGAGGSVAFVSRASEASAIAWPACEIEPAWPSSGGCPCRRDIRRAPPTFPPIRNAAAATRQFCGIRSALAKLDRRLRSAGILRRSRAFMPIGEDSGNR
jgi:hypothetical protein